MISYLAIRGHIGWIKELGVVLPAITLYEVHVEEDEEMSNSFIAELKNHGYWMH